jgi:hypothetical protein
MGIFEFRFGFPLEEEGAPLHWSKGRIRFVAPEISQTEIACAADLECIGCAVSDVANRAY